MHTNGNNAVIKPTSDGITPLTHVMWMPWHRCFQWVPN